MLAVASQPGSVRHLASVRRRVLADRTAPHIPDIAKIKALPDADMRFYALGGAVMSLAAALELKYFDLFVRATKSDRNQSARYFYLILNASTRRQMADAALRAVLTDPLLSEWGALLAEIQELTGNNGDRNLLAHAVVHEVVSGGPVSPSGFFGLTQTDYRVEQDAAVLLAYPNRRPAQDFDKLCDYAERLIGALKKVDDFLISCRDFVGDQQHQ